jgi:uncharacterized protein YqjF (DUF2071 family)
MLATPSPFLTAQWSDLILATYPVDPDALLPLLPPGCHLETIDGRGRVSLVAFNFLETRVLGVRWPGFVNFPEVNLRFYVRHGNLDDADSTARRGVVFIREFVPQRTVAALARWTYNEPYRAARMRSSVTSADDGLVVEHQLRVAGRTRTIRVTADAARYRPAADSTEASLINHQWGFGTSRRGRLIRYQVVHEPWDVHPVRSFELDWDWAAAYGPRFADLQRAEPASVVLAVGSAVSIFPRGWIDPVAASPSAVVP